MTPALDVVWWSTRKVRPLMLSAAGLPDAPLPLGELRERYAAWLHIGPYQEFSLGGDYR